ncbi:hypothetical protein QNH39_23350 [Neobacillus novalis]|uniref:Uncharacterized protein n=1 Tax=Neobacillus novalis TaxID=220687 RepID=A0AA95SAK6_9BACI|nr:hypothetical protein [Neobacillus novalis]WHY85514.1 hypothetical protein QNH39_23350 [Neobacillus novalis]
MLKMFIKGRYFYHIFQHRHIELLQQDCLCEDLKARLKIKSTYHNSKAVELGSLI